MEPSNSGIDFANCEQHETEQGSRKNKIFPAKVLFLEVSNYNQIQFLSAVLVNLLIFIFSLVDAMLDVSGLLKLSCFEHMWTLM